MIDVEVASWYTLSSLITGNSFANGRVMCLLPEYIAFDAVEVFAELPLMPTPV